MSQVKERPILFSAPMVRAILEGRKTVTRRVMKSQPDADATITVESYNVAVTNRRGYQEAGPEIFGAWWRDGESGCKCPYGQPGDRLWVRESHAQVFEVDIPDRRPVGPIGTAGSPGRPDWKCRYVYRADGDMPNVQWHHVGDSQPVRWTPSIHMRREASRILLEITDVRVERLQDITYEQAAAEGVHRGPLREWCASDEGGACHKYPVHAFRDLWQSVGGNWDANPWVWVVEFKRVTP
ncbi:hypothetical protein [Pseudomonas simiae]|uniref:hypothetical protein n=1 Tax=Pseudomonas simiae TaxID=321846 RepID=UPI0020950998|nr:hypothetical protein [Pseudomonas simiae]